MPEGAKWETEHLAWKADMLNRGNKNLPEEFIKEKMVFEQEGGEGRIRRWQPAPRETEADLAMDTQSLRRRLDQRLFLLVKGKGKPPALKHIEASYCIPSLQWVLSLSAWCYCKNHTLCMFQVCKQDDDDTFFEQ